MDPDSTLSYIRMHITKDHVRLQVDEVDELTQGHATDTMSVMQAFNDMVGPLTSRSSAVNQSTTKAAPNLTRTVVQTHHTHTTTDDTQLYIERNSIYVLAMGLIDPSTTLLFDESLKDSIKKFKKDMVENLSNGNQLFKKLGFSRRKNVSIEAMTEALLNHKGNEALSPEIFEYLAKLARRTMVVIDFSSTPPKRTEFSGDDDIRFIMIDKSTYQHLEFEDEHALRTHLSQRVKDSAVPLSRQTAVYLKELAKYLGFKAVSKAGVTKDVLLGMLSPLLGA